LSALGWVGRFCYVFFLALRHDDYCGSVILRFRVSSWWSLFWFRFTVSLTTAIPNDEDRQDNEE